MGVVMGYGGGRSILESKHIVHTPVHVWILIKHDDGPF